MSDEEKQFDLENRVIDFAVRIINLADSLPRTKVGYHIADQIMRSGTSPASNYGEAQSAESHSDFIHKMKICLKELRETKIWLTVIERTKILTPSSRIDPLLDENEQLISIFYTSEPLAKVLS